MSDVKLALIPQNYVADIWPVAEPYIKRSVEYSYGLITIKDHRDAVLAGDKQLWIACEDEPDAKVLAACVTEIVNGMCLIWAIGGTQMNRWLHLYDTLEQWSVAQRCKGLHIYGRPGWARVLRNRGYKKRLVVLYKDIAQ